MNLRVSDKKGMLSQGLLMLAERRLQFALGRFESRIRSVALTVSDLTGPRGGIDKVCRIAIGLRGVPMIVVTENDADLSKALSRLADRVSRTVAREVERLHHPDRRRPADLEVTGAASGETTTLP